MPNIFKNTDGTNMEFFLTHTIAERVSLRNSIEEYGGKTSIINDNKNKDLIILGDPLKDYKTPDIVSYYFILDSINLGKLLNIKEYYVNLSSEMRMNNLKKKRYKNFSKNEDILIDIMRYLQIFKNGIEIHDEISKKYEKHLFYTLDDYQFVFEPKFEPILLAKLDFNNNFTLSKYIEQSFLKNDCILIDFPKNLNLLYKDELVYKKLDNLYLHQNYISLRNPHANILLSLFDTGYNFNYNLKNENILNNISFRKSKNYIYDISKESFKSINKLSFFMSNPLIQKSDGYNTIYNFGDRIKKSYEILQIQIYKANEVILNNNESVPKYDFSRDDLKKNNSSDTDIHYILKNISKIKCYDSLDNSLFFPDTLVNKRTNSPEIYVSSKRRKLLRGFTCNNSKNDDLILNRNITLHEIKQKDLNIRQSKDLKEINKQGYLVPVNTDKIQNASTTMITSNAYSQSQINNYLQMPVPLLSLKKSVLNLNKENDAKTSVSSNVISDGNLSIHNQKISQISKFNSQESLPNSPILSNNINQTEFQKDLDSNNQNVNFYGRNLNDHNPISIETTYVLRKTVDWYLRNMKKYNITQQDVTLALYRTSGIKKLAIIVMDAMSKNLPLPNIKGIWTEEDDIIVYCGNSKELKQLNKKHGGKLHNRIRFLQDYLK
ncbi:hypothetical protein PNEG_00369 [Pneumocystis murina B123]|uniref:DNA-binding protein RAP1 n=1 Tax=Pneumocystis murina (strain B123) TaxID=1069680 RepID=M7PBU4_PNEMU|nr:hypothetical protein PNEG_00369 [Pneumocystis murina B123]EMR11340.1 hypothetical protein PNEG_00369 [Pneumocystis murina B123]